VATFQEAGFKKMASTERNHPYYDLWIVAAKEDLKDEELFELAKLHFPIVS